MIAYTDYRNTLRDYLAGQNFRFHLTFNYNRAVSYPAARDKLKFWTSRVLRCLFGRNYYRLDQTTTVFYYAFPEYGAGGDNLHFHALTRVAENKINAFVPVAQRQWEYVIPSGDLHVQTIGEGAHHQAAVISYDTKALSRSADYIISTEFAPSK